MPSIEIQRSHSKSLVSAKKSVDRVAEHIAKKFAVAAEWQGNTLHFSRSGVDGHIKVSAKRVQVTVNLGLFLLMLKGSIEHEIEHYLDQEFGMAPDDRQTI